MKTILTFVMMLFVFVICGFRELCIYKHGREVQNTWRDTKSIIKYIMMGIQRNALVDLE